MISVLLTRAGISEDEICRIKGTFGGSTCTWHLKSKGCRAPGFRRQLMGRPARTGHLLARSRPAGGSTDRSRRPRLERFSVRELGVTEGLGQGSLSPEPRAFDNRRGPAQDALQRHPGRHPQPANLCDGDPNHRHRSSHFRSLAREGDVRGDVGPTRDPRRGEDGGLATTRWDLENEDPPTIRRLSTEGDVQGDVDHSCCSRMFSPNTAACRPPSPGVTSS
jgi:hypothetical protein